MTEKRTPTHHTLLNDLKFHFDGGYIQKEKEQKFISDLYRLKNIGKLDKVTPGQAVWLYNIHLRHVGKTHAGSAPWDHPFQDEDIRGGDRNGITKMLMDRFTEKEEEANRRHRERQAAKDSAFASVDRMLRRRKRGD